MADLVNIFSQEIRNKIKRDIPFIQGAYVEFYDDITAGAIETAQLSKDNNITASLDIILNQIAAWNLADEVGELPITMESLKRLPIKILKWLADEQSSIISDMSEPKKKE